MQTIIKLGEPISKQRKFYVGKAWRNKTSFEDNNGELRTFETIDIKLNSTIKIDGIEQPLQSLDLHNGLKIQLVANEKREGKEKIDADYQLVIKE